MKDERSKYREELAEILNVPIYPRIGIDPLEAVTDYLLDNNVLPVVLCKDCKYCECDSKPDDTIVCKRTNDGYWRSSNDFCSGGIRNENGGRNVSGVGV